MKSLKKLAVVLLAVVMVMSVFTACDIKITPEQKILGAWRDSTGTMGYEFKEDGICKITYADVVIPIINYPYNGTIDGTYSITKDEADNYHVIITYTILSKSMNKDYIFTVKDSALTLTDMADSTVTTLIAYTDPATQTTAAQ
ncbi:MAG: hypothetical protein J6Q79_05735 [Clostridia bacterium]|nr:hypothetical protein [Clostridia bacterium]